MKKSLIIVFMVFCACETVVDLDIEFRNPSLVLNGFINPDSVMAVEISENTSILDEVPFKIIEGATVNIYEDDKFLGQLKPNNPGIYVNNDLVPKRGVNYKIEVIKEGYDNIVGETRIPVEFPSIGIKIDSVINQGLKEFKIEFEIDDPVGEDYYELAIFGYRKIYEFDEITQQLYLNDSILGPLWLNTDDLAIDEFQRDSYNYTYVLNDNLFDGKKYAISLRPLPGVFEGNLTDQLTTFIFVLRNVNKDYYLYQRSKALQSWVDGDPFAEPVPVHNNIQNGFGIFAGYNQTNQVVSIK